MLFSEIESCNNNKKKQFIYNIIINLGIKVSINRLKAKYERLISNSFFSRLKLIVKLI